MPRPEVKEDSEDASSESIESGAQGWQSMCASPAKLDKFDGTGDIDSFWDHFEVVAQANGWPPRVQLLQLPTCLTGAAFACFRRLPVEERNTLRKLKDALQKEFGSRELETDYAQRLMRRTREPTESLMDFSDALTNLARKAYSDIDYYVLL